MWPGQTNASDARSRLGRGCAPALALMLVLLPARADTDAAPPPSPATLQVSGFGLLSNRAIRNTLLELLPDKEVATFDANFVEDSFLILHNRLVAAGYLDPMVIANVTLTNQEIVALWWDGEGELEVPRDLQAREVRFEALRGVLHFYDTLVIKGVTALPPARARGFFVPRDVLLNLKTARRFSPADLHASMRNLRRELSNLGYRDAVVEAGPIEMDHETGKVRVTVLVTEGPRYMVRDLQVAGPDPLSVEPPPLAPGQPYSIAWQQDASQSMNVQLYRQGYPDAETHLVEAGRTNRGDVIGLDLVAQVDAGEQVELGEVRFRGATHTRESFLRRRARLKGPLLDRVEADRVRERLARLGHFRFVDLDIEPSEGSPRDVVYELTEGKRFDLSLIGGYGSYDQLFGGVEFDHYNLWGVGHNTRLKLVQSFKSTVGSYTYTVPEFLAPGVNLFAAADGFRREELTFDREEVKLSVGLRRQFLRTGQQLGVRYAYQFLDAQTAAVGDEATRAAAIIADWQLDRRDNPLLPRDGHRFQANVEYADPALGGESEYVRLELGASYHHPFGRGLILHLGLSQGIVASPDRTTLLPFNKRFFPGGENSVRGYQRGGASPLDANGDQLGAESALQWNVELEQQLTRSISVVGFVDGVGITPEIESWPWDEVLWSVGGGVRWNTVIGPVRLEYGYNLDPRPADPVGTLHFSIGFPF